MNFIATKLIELWTILSNFFLLCFSQAFLLHAPSSRLKYTLNYITRDIARVVVSSEQCCTLFRFKTIVRLTRLRN